MKKLLHTINANYYYESLDGFIERLQNIKNEFSDYKNLSIEVTKDTYKERGIEEYYEVTDVNFEIYGEQK